jgi:protein SCO1/2
MDHTAGSYVYDTRGKLRLFTRYGTKPELTAADIRQLLASAT